MKMIQVKLTNSSSELVTWVEDDKRLKKGCIVVLKEHPNIKWRLTEKYKISIDKELLHIDWKVGGL